MGRGSGKIHGFKTTRNAKKLPAQEIPSLSKRSYQGNTENALTNKKRRSYGSNRIDEARTNG